MSADGPSTPTVVGQVELDDGGENLDVDRWVKLAQRALEHQGVGGRGELSLHFVSAAAMTELNSTHMGEQGPTDVLAFPLDAFAEDELVDGTGPSAGNGDQPPRLLGDIVVCPEVAEQNARDHNRSLDDELALLVVHGLLHILGHDHAEPGETAAMNACQEVLLDSFHRVSSP